MTTKTKVFKAISLFILLCFFKPSFSQLNNTANYINSVFYYKRLSMLRNAYETKDQTKKGMNSLIMDFNFYARDKDNDLIMPMMVGIGTSDTTVFGRMGYYFLAYSTNLFNFAPLDDTTNASWFEKNLSFHGTSDEQKKRLRYYGISAGMSFDLNYVKLLADITYSKNTFTYYGQAFVPVLNTHFGATYSKFKEMDYDIFDENGDSIRVKVIGISDSYHLDMVDLKNYSLKKVVLGFKYIKMIKARYVPNISMSLSQAFPNRNFPFDMEFFFETRGHQLADVISMKDFDTRFTYYFSPIEKVFTWYTGVSYKSKEDGYSRTISESGRVYNGQNGIGFEFGFATRNPDKESSHGFLDKNFIKYCIYYNYSEYFDRYPGNVWGMKFRILL